MPVKSSRQKTELIIIIEIFYQAWDLIQQIPYGIDAYHPLQGG